MKLDGWRAALAALLLGGLGVAAWLSLPPHRPRYSAETLLKNQRFLFWPQPSWIEGTVEFVSGAVRLQPGHSLVYEPAKIQGLLSGSFQASGPTAATVEMLLVDANGHRDVLVRRSLESADAGRRFFLFEPRSANGPGSRFELRVAADSPGAVDWREFREVSRENLDLSAALQLPLVIYEGFTAPFTDGPIAYTHAPSQYLLAVPRESNALRLRFGFNPAVFAQSDFGSDGLVFQARLEARPEAAARVIWEKAVAPSEREVQRAEVTLPAGEGLRLRLLVLPGTQGNTAWDWAFWGPLTPTPPRLSGNESGTRDTGARGTN